MKNPFASIHITDPSVLLESDSTYFEYGKQAVIVLGKSGEVLAQVSSGKSSNVMVVLLLTNLPEPINRAIESIPI